MDKGEFVDYYETLKISPNADSDTIDMMFRHLAKRWHPDNHQTGNMDRFEALMNAYKVLSDPTKRAAFDAKYDEVLALKTKVLLEISVDSGLSGEQRIRHGILSTLYIARRRNAQKAGVGNIQLEQVLGCPQDQVDFNIWYLAEKGWIQRTENGTLAITAAGVDAVEEKHLTLRRDRLLPDVQDSIRRSHTDEAGEADSITQPAQISMAEE